MAAGWLSSGTIVVPAAFPVSIRSTMPSPLASAPAPGQLAAMPVVKPWKCCQCTVSAGAPCTLTSVLSLSPLTAKWATPAVLVLVTPVFMGCSCAVNDACPGAAARCGQGECASDERRQIRVLDLHETVLGCDQAPLCADPPSPA